MYISKTLCSIKLFANKEFFCSAPFLSNVLKYVGVLLEKESIKGTGAVEKKKYMNNFDDNVVFVLQSIKQSPFGTRL